MSEEKKERSSTEPRIEQYRLVGLPKGTVLWPTGAVALIFGLITLAIGESSSFLTAIFLVVFTINLLILFFDFARGAIVGIVGIAFGIIGISMALELEFPLFVFIETAITGVPGSFLVVYGALFLIIMFLGYFFKRTFDYYVISSNEIVKKEGILGDAHRYNAPDLHIEKEIKDVLESLILFGSGDLRITTPKGQQFIIENVPRINYTEKQIRNLLAKIEVDFSR